MKGPELSPNPARSFVRSDHTSNTQQDGQVRIINNNGQVVQQIIIHLIQGTNHQVITIDRLTPGVYHAGLITTDGKDEIARFIKQ